MRRVKGEKRRLTRIRIRALLEKDPIWKTLGGKAKYPRQALLDYLRGDGEGDSAKRSISQWGNVAGQVGWVQVRFLAWGKVKIENIYKFSKPVAKHM